MIERIKHEISVFFQIFAANMLYLWPLWLIIFIISVYAILFLWSD